MSSLSVYNLSHTSTKIIEKLFQYRGMTAPQITKCLYGVQHTISQEKNIYNYLNKLSKGGLVTNHRLQGSYARGSLYFLTLRGYEFAKEWLNILEGQKGNGWIKADKSSFADIPYPIYKPPLVQTSHHLLLIDFFIQVEDLTEVEVDYRLNLYASKTYQIMNEKVRFRPDAEIKFFDGRIFTIECDLGSESHSQFRQKFQVYKKYFDYLTEHEDEGLPDGILFIVPDKIRDHGMKRRWANIASAFFEEIGPYHSQVNLIMTTLSKVQETLQFEDDRMQYEINTVKEVYNQLLVKNTNVFAYTRPSGYIQENAFMYAIQHQKYEVYFNAVCQEFETRIYSRFMLHSDKILGKCKSHEVIKDLEYEHFKINVFFSGRQPFFFSRTLDKTFEISEQLTRACHFLNNEARFIDLQEIDLQIDGRN